MALAYNNRRAGPKTHVLIIGVGGYRHLNGHPDGPRIRDPLAYGGLGQLTSPPLSAIALRNSFLGSDPQAWRAPLGSIDVLISPHPDMPNPGGDGKRFTEPTRRNIQKAFDKWWDRCDTDADNIAIFYFCGHGLEADEQYVLAADFGANEQRPWENAIAIDTTIKGLWQNKADTQCVFIDACREVTEASKATPKINASVLSSYAQGGTGPRPHTLEIKAVAAEEQAFASPNAPAYFTNTLIAALEGAAAEEDPDTGEFVVSTASMTAKFFDVLRGVAPHRPEIPRPSAGLPTVLYRPPTKPMVDVTVDCSPHDALRTARLSCQATQGGKNFKRAAPMPTPWTQPVPAGYYNISATFEPGAEFVDRVQTVLASPPRRSRTLRVLS